MERCPLGSGLYWENKDQIPEFCQQRCGHMMTSNGSVPEDGAYDYFLYEEGAGCGHLNLETEDCSLQRGEGAERSFSVTDECLDCGGEYGAQSYRFICPYE